MSDNDLKRLFSTLVSLWEQECFAVLKQWQQYVEMQLSAYEKELPPPYRAVLNFSRLLTALKARKQELAEPATMWTSNQTQFVPVFPLLFVYVCLLIYTFRNALAECVFSLPFVEEFTVALTAVLVNPVVQRAQLYAVKTDATNLSSWISSYASD